MAKAMASKSGPERKGRRRLSNGELVQELLAVSGHMIKLQSEMGVDDRETELKTNAALFASQLLINFIRCEQKIARQQKVALI